MLISSSVCPSLWGEALLTTCPMLNRVPQKTLSVTPYEIWSGMKPNLGYFKERNGVVLLRLNYKMNTPPKLGREEQFAPLLNIL